MKSLKIFFLLSSVFFQNLYSVSPDFKKAVELIKKNPSKRSIDYTNLEKILSKDISVATEHFDEPIQVKQGEIDPKDFTLLHYVAAYNSVDAFKLLRAQCADVPGILDIQEGEMKLTPLMVAIQHGAREVAQLLLDYGASIGMQATDKKTVLHYAVQAKNRDLVIFLLKRGAIGLRSWIDDNGKKPIDLTIDQSIKDLLVPISIEYIANLVKASKIETIKDLLNIRSGVVSDTLQNDKSTCLHLMVSAQNLDLIKAVLLHKPDVDAQDKLGKTALHRAVEEYFKDTKNDVALQVVIALLRAGASPHVSDSSKKTPLAIVQEKMRPLNKEIDAAKKLLELFSGDIPVSNEDVQKECSRIGDILKEMSKRLGELKDDLSHLNLVVSVV